MRSRIAVGAVVVGAALAHGGCDQPQGPRMCLVPADGADPATQQVPATCPSFSVAAGDALYLVYQLPPGIDPPGPLEIRIDTPCLTVNVERPLEAGTTVSIIRAPQGADCSMAVTATLANSTIRQVTSPAAGACMRITCDTSSDAGPTTPDAGGGDGGP